MKSRELTLSVTLLFVSCAALAVALALLMPSGIVRWLYVFWWLLGLFVMVYHAARLYGKRREDPRWWVGVIPRLMFFLAYLTLVILSYLKPKSYPMVDVRAATDVVLILYGAYAVFVKAVVMAQKQEREVEELWWLGFTALSFLLLFSTVALIKWLGQVSLWF